MAKRVLARLRSRVRFPSPIFLQTEDGCPGGLEIESFGLIENFTDLRSAIGALASEPASFSDRRGRQRRRARSADLDAMSASRKVGHRSKVPVTAKGYVVIDTWWLDILKGLDYLRRQRGMTIVRWRIPRSRSINDPRAASLQVYQLRLHKRARGLVQDAMDAIGFLAPDLARAERRNRLRQETQSRRRRLAALAALRGTAELRRQESIRTAGKNAGAEKFQLRGARSVPTTAAVGGHRRQTQPQTHPKPTTQRGVS